jgi:hypothetical protein
MKTFGEKLSPVLVEIETLILENNTARLGPPFYTDQAFRAACCIFMDALMDKMYATQESEKIEFSDRNNMAESAGIQLRKLVKTYTGIETHNLY